LKFRTEWLNNEHQQHHQSPDYNDSNYNITTSSKTTNSLETTIKNKTKITELDEFLDNKNRVLIGFIQAGVLTIGDKVFFGPTLKTSFVKVIVASIRINNVSIKYAKAGQTVTIKLMKYVELPENAADNNYLNNAEFNSNEPKETANGENEDVFFIGTSPKNERKTSLKKEISQEQEKQASIDLIHDFSNKFLSCKIDNGTNNEKMNGVVNGFATTTTVSNNKDNSDSNNNNDDNHYNGYNSNYKSNSNIAKRKRFSATGLVLLMQNLNNSNKSNHDLSSKFSPVGYWEFDAEIIVLNHPGKIRINYEPVIHVGAIKQSVKLLKIFVKKKKLVVDDDCGSKKVVNHVVDLKNKIEIADLNDKSDRKLNNVNNKDDSDDSNNDSCNNKDSSIEINIENSNSIKNNSNNNNNNDELEMEVNEIGNGDKAICRSNLFDFLIFFVYGIHVLFLKKIKK
jgi:hypothetical protein